MKRSISIISTVGPSSWDEDMVIGQIQLGVNCFRFPFSKESPAKHMGHCQLIQRVAADLGVSIHAMADLPGGKPRLQNKEACEVDGSKRYKVCFDGSGKLSADFLIFPPLLANSVTENSVALIGDGDNEFIIETVSDGVADGRFKYSGQLHPTRAFLPIGNEYSIATLTEIDRAFVREIYRSGFDWVALSFVDSAHDVNETRDWFQTELNWRPKIVAKIETKLGVSNISEIVTASDYVMIARGDLALQVGFENLWYCQRSIIQACKGSNAQSIVGTGLLDHFAKENVWSRSESIDIITCLEMGADALMLSAETAVGTYPLKVVSVLCRHIEAWQSA